MLYGKAFKQHIKKHCFETLFFKLLKNHIFVIGKLMMEPWKNLQGGPWSKKDRHTFPSR